MKGLIFQDKVAVITGASSGIGSAIARRLAAQGAQTVLAARRAERLESVAAEIQQASGRALAVPTDVTDEAQCQRLVERTLESFGQLDLLVNSAGFGLSARLQDMPDLKLFRLLMSVNFDGMLHCTFHALPHLIEAQGWLVNIASLGGLFALPNNTAYVASKFAMRGFSEALRLDLGNSGASVTVVYPFWVVSEFHEKLLDKQGQPRGSRGRKVYTPRTMTSDECARRTLQAAARRQRQVVMWPGGPARWLQLLAPGWLDWIIINFVVGSAYKRIRQESH